MIKFEKYIDYIENILQTTTKELYDNSQNPDTYDPSSKTYGAPYIETNFIYTNFSNSGEYKKSKYLGDNPDEVISVFLDNGITRDTSIDMTTYLQDIDIEFLVFEDKFPDFNTVLNEISREYKNKVITIDKKPAIIMISLSHDQPDKVEIQAEHRLLTKVNVNIIVYENYFLANDFKMTISGEEIPFSTLSIARNVETVADGRKMIDQRFLQNTSGCTIGLSAPFMNTPMSKRIVKDISKAGSFSEVYHLTIKHPDYDDLVLVDGNYIFSTGTIQMEFGSIISYTAQFILASDIK